jgi:TatD DNase family protein
LVETDAPFLTPHPLRGKRNEPVYIKHTVEKIANLREESVEHIAQVTTANAFRLFQWSKPL